MKYIPIIITILITAAITHFLTLYRERKNWNRTLELQKIQDYNKAADKFCSEFIEAMHTLNRKNDIVSAFYILQKTSLQHEAAMLQFRRYLSGKELEVLDATWKTYVFSTEHPEPYKQYHGHANDEVLRLRKLALQRIEKLLECAKPK